MQSRRKKILIYTLAVITLGFVLLSVLVYLFPESAIDLKFSEEVQEHKFPLLDMAMKMVSYPGYVWVAVPMVLLTALLFLPARYKKEALFVVLTLASGAVSSVVKMLVNRPRPGADVIRVIEETRQQSFPSGHTQFYVTFFGFLIVLMYTLKALPVRLRLSVSIVSLLLIFTIPFSRMYLGAHWFTDVLGGFMLGLLCLSALAYFYLRKTGEKV
ncbi:MAG: phosphatase PAP2 family protein [Sphingobacteriales bacterium]|nr:MAG: phosphatase PAP2 family protein [Sphingobacteriales bacterium]